jgi:protease I
LRHFLEQKKPLALTCHAPLALIADGMLKGRRTAAYPALEPDVQAAGAEFVNAEAVVDGAMVSARAWPDNPAWMREFIRVLRQKAPIS